jgi:two-component system sensor histidine kinase KdpD
MQIRVSGPELTAKSNFVQHTCMRLADGLKPLAAGVAEPGLSSRAVVAGSVKGIGVIAAVTAGLVVLEYSIVLKEFEHLSLLMYLAVVVLAATRWGTLPAIITALASGAAQAFFFYPPHFSFQVDDPHNILHLMVFLLVAFATGNLAARLRRERDLAQAREAEIRGLYEFSRRLASGFSADDLIAAVQDYLSNTLGRPTIMVPPPGSLGIVSADRTGLPTDVQAEALAMMAPGAPEQRAIADFETGRLWLLRAVSSQAVTYGVIAVDLGNRSIAEVARTKVQADGVLAETNARLERLDVETALSTARSRARADDLRAALIGTVSHELRSPIASIVGSASVLDRVPAIRQNGQVQSLVESVLEEAKRLDDDIQKLLDATRIAARNVRPQQQSVDILDVVDRSVGRKRRELDRHDLRINVARDVPRVLADPVLIEQAVAQLLENAAKYSAAGSVISIAARREHQNVVISVTDQGSGLTTTEKALVGRRAFRGEQHRNFVPGSGLGLWIAHSLVAANGGLLEAESNGSGRGTTISVRLRAEHADNLLPAKVSHG